MFRSITFVIFALAFSAQAQASDENRIFRCSESYSAAVAKNRTPFFVSIVENRRIHDPVFTQGYDEAFLVRVSVSSYDPWGAHADDEDSLLFTAVAQRRGKYYQVDTLGMYGVKFHTYLGGDRAFLRFEGNPRAGIPPIPGLIRLT